MIFAKSDWRREIVLNEKILERKSDFTFALA